MATNSSAGLASKSGEEDIAREQKERELEALLGSGLIREHTDLHTLLGYLGRKSVEKEGPLKEYTIGVEALGKPKDYDPRLDPTVRVDISKLRARLRDYYQTRGAERPVHIQIPKGEYHLAFLPGPQPAAADQTRRPIRLALAAAVAAVSLMAVWGLGKMVVRGAPASTLAPELQALWAPFLQGSVPTVISYGTPLFLKLDRTFHRDPRVNRPEDQGESEPLERIVGLLEPDERRWVATYTGVGEAEALFMLTRMLASQGVSLSIQRSNHLSWEDMKGKHVILLGSHKSLAQIPGLPVTPKFQVASDPPRVENLTPAGEEPASYLTVRDTPNGEVVEEYALISVYEGLQPRTHLMVLSCSSTEGTAAAAEYVTRAETVRELFRQMGLDPRASRVPLAFQVVVKARMKSGIPVRLDYAAHHVLAH